jgi:hypothetical protein
MKTLFDGHIQENAKYQIELPWEDGTVTKRTERALILLDAVSRLKVLRNDIRELYRLERELDKLRVDVFIKESREWDE